MPKSPVEDAASAALVKQVWACLRKRAPTVLVQNRIQKGNPDRLGLSAGKKKKRPGRATHPGRCMPGGD
jgi:hypothetical protein